MVNQLWGWLRRALAIALLAAAASVATAQDAYPTRPIKLVVPYPAGALTDLLARAIAERLGAALKEPVVIENKPGAGTLFGAEVVAKAPPDGYTLLMATSTTLGISPALYPASPINPVRDFAPIAQIGSVNFFLIATPGFPAKTVSEMIEAVRQAPGKYSYASVGSGSPHHLFMEVLKTEEKLDVQHVPYKGTPPAIIERLATEMQKIQATPEFREQLFRFAMEPAPPNTPTEFAAFIRAEQPRWARAVKDSGAKVD